MLVWAKSGSMGRSPALSNHDRRGTKGSVSNMGRLVPDPYYLSLARLAAHLIATDKIISCALNLHQCSAYVVESRRRYRSSERIMRPHVLIKSIRPGLIAFEESWNVRRRQHLRGWSGCRIIRRYSKGRAFAECSWRPSRSIRYFVRQWLGWFCGTGLDSCTGTTKVFEDLIAQCLILDLCSDSLFLRLVVITALTVFLPEDILVDDNLVACGTQLCVHSMSALQMLPHRGGCVASKSIASVR